MMPNAVLDLLDERGIDVHVEDERLVIEGDEDSLTDDLLEAARRCKRQLVHLVKLRNAGPCPGSLATSLDEYRDAFRQVYDTPDCKRCGDPVLLDEGKFYVDWFNGRPHREVCRGRR